MTKAKNNDGRHPPRTTAKNTTDVHIHKPRPQKLRTTGLHAIADTAKTYGRIASPAAVQRANERLAIATSTVPWCNSTTPRNYRAPELSAVPARAPVDRSNELPSRIGALLFYRDGRVTTLDGTPAKAAA